MGCSGSKYQALSAENSTKVESTDTTTNAVTASTTSSAPQSSTAASPGKEQIEQPSVGPPPWGAGCRPQSAIPEFEPPLAENAGDEDNVEEDMTSENLEERFPPWKESDKMKPAQSPNKHGMVLGPPSNGLGGYVPATSSTAPASPTTSFDNTVIIFDWDDTLLCSSALHCCLPNQFVELEETVETVLLMSMSLGRTIIVTNAMESWIQETAKKFMPRLMPTLDRLLIVYARKNWERLWPGDTFAWKRESFRETLNDKLGSDLNLLVLGDSLSEIRAAEALAEFLGVGALVKTVKFKALPSPTDLLGQLRTIGPELSKLVEERHSASKELYQEIPSGGLFSGGVFQGAPSWQLLDSVPSEMFAPPPGVFAPWSVPPVGGQITQITI